MCDNETHVEAVFGEGESRSAHPKDAVDRAVVHGDPSLLATDGRGTKVALRYSFAEVAPGETVRVRLRLLDDAWAEGSRGDSDLPAVPRGGEPFGQGFDDVVTTRRREADAFYAEVVPEDVGDEERLVARRAFAGLNWSKQALPLRRARVARGRPGRTAATGLTPRP